ncbi:MAG: ImmA/IrrE family metallo-endopeptidase [Acidobacteria bacterium]|nr:ImmA/IrrE family metallo-endopeptidase [Acidobacteriota bacterium]
MVPEFYARALLDRLSIAGVPDVRQIATTLRVPVHERPLERCEGMLVRIKGTAKAAIAVKNSIREDSRKRFTVAHELGHLLLPGHDNCGVCTSGVIETWAGDVREKEREANAFAAELLMPAAVLLRHMADKTPSLGLVEGIAEAFKTSLTASGYRFVGLTSYAVALVWSEAGRTRWAKRSEEFSSWLRLRETLDARTLAADLFRGVDVPTGAHAVPADAWLERAEPDATLVEESRLLPSYGAVVTLLWAKEANGGQEADELLKELDPSDFSVHRERWPTRRR